MFLNKFNLGLFAFNASSGSTLTKNKNRWKAETEQIINLAKMADDCKLDFLLPERFDLNYIDKDGKRERPIIIHKGLVGTFERLMSILMEQYKGAFPF